MLTNPLPFPLNTQPHHFHTALQRPLEERVLQHKGQSFDLQDLLALADAIARQLMDLACPSKRIGLYLQSPFHFAAALLGAWQSSYEPVLIDPSSRAEIETIVEATPSIHFLAHPSHLPDHPQTLLLPSPTQTPSIPRFPELDAPMVSFFTSGSEGRSKLIPKKGRQIYAHVGAVCHMLDIPPQCRALSFVPLFHILGFSYGLMAPLRMKGQTSVMVGQTPMAMREALLTQQPHLVVATAVHYRYLNAVLTPEDALPDAVFISSGAPLPEDVRDKFISLTGRQITELYGSTETAGIARKTGDTPWTPYPGAQTKIQDERLWVRSPWAHPDSTTQWLETHDVAEPQGDGFRLLGRANNIIKIGGKRFSSLEVERAIRKHPAIDDVAAVSYERFGEPALAAFVVKKPDAQLEITDLREFLAQQLSPFKIPRTLSFVPALPRKKLQKLDYQTLRQLAQKDETPE